MGAKIVRVLVAVLVAVLVVGLLASGCSGSDGSDPAPPESPSQHPADTIEARSVLYDDDFLVEEGVWWLGVGYPPVPTVLPGTSNGLLGVVGPVGMWVSGPGLYGKYRVRIESAPTRPPVPRWCEDVVEVAYPHRVDGIWMGSFETQTRRLPLPPDNYRVRYCAEGLDRAATEPEFDGNRYHVYSSRHLFQLWPAPLRPDAVVRAGSDFARSENERVAQDSATR